MNEIIWGRGRDNPIINVMIGPPCSGKTTKAMEVVRAHSGIVRISKDALRLQLNGSLSVSNGVNTEPLIDSIYESMIEKAIQRGFSVILDTTNCEYKTLVKRLEAYIQLADVNLVFMAQHSLSELFAREDNRVGTAIPPAVMAKMHVNYTKLLAKKDKLQEICDLRGQIVTEAEHVYNSELPDAVIIDLDDTVAIKASSRGPYEWAKVGEDSPIEDMIRLVNSLEPSIVRIFLTGRSYECSEDTGEWINKHFIFNTEHPTYAPVLLMRDEKDFRPAPETKSALFEEFVRGKYNVITVFDDDPRAINMYRRKGLHALQCKTQIRE